MKLINNIYNTTPPTLISFGTTERSTNKYLDPYCCNLANCDYFIRPDETPANKMGQFLLYEAKNAEEVEMKVWGCSDLSSFVSRKLAMIKEVGSEKYRELFGNIELIDIDEDIISRAQKGLIGVTNSEIHDVSKIIGMNFQDYLTPLKDKRGFFLEGEPERIPLYSAEAYSYFLKTGKMCGEYETIKPYKLSDVVMDGLDIRVGDIREDIKTLSNPRRGVKRIFEFANGWHFMSPNDRVNLVTHLSKKMQISDIMIVGGCELNDGIDKLLRVFGFGQLNAVPEAFRKIKDLNFIERNIIKYLANR